MDDDGFGNNCLAIHLHLEITEQYKTQTGRLITKEIIMRLKKEGDNQ